MLLRTQKADLLLKQIFLGDDAMEDDFMSSISEDESEIPISKAVTGSLKDSENSSNTSASLPLPTLVESGSGKFPLESISAGGSSFSIA